MASGTLELVRNSTGQYLTGRVLWSSTSNGTTANNSTVTAELQLQRAALNTTTGTFKGTFTLGSTSKTISWYGSLPSQQWVTIDTLTVTVNHDTSGKGSCYIYANINGPSGTTMAGTYVSGSATVTLDSISRYATIISVTGFTDSGNDNPTITYSNPAGSAVSSLQACLSIDGSNADIAYRNIPMNGTEYTFPLSTSELNVLRAATPNSNSLNLIARIRSTIGGVTEHSDANCRMTITDAEPTLNPTVTDSNSTTKNLTGNSSKLIRYHSNATVTFNDAVYKYATLKSRKVTCGNKSLTANGTINGVESGTFEFTVVDSRGNTATKTITPTFVNYIKLTCDLQNALPDANGNMAVHVSGNYFNGSFGSRSNSLKVYYRYKTLGGTFENWRSITTKSSGNTYTADVTVSGLNYRSSYVFEAYAADSLETVYSESITVKASPVFDWGEDDFAFHVPVAMQEGAVSQRLSADDDLDLVLNNGWYDWLSGKAPANAPSGAATGSMYSMRVFSRGYACIQECCDTTTNRGCIIQRTLNDDGATQWEWINPPMLVGYEFRTTERYNGKPVYMKLVNFGALPANSTKSMTVSGMYYPFTITGTTSGNRSIPHAGYITVRGSYQEIEVTTTVDYSSTTATLLVKYLKEAP